MTLLETAQGLRDEALDEWLETLSLEEKKELVVQTFEEIFELLDKLAGMEASSGEIPSDVK